MRHYQLPWEASTSQSKRKTTTHRENSLQACEADGSRAQAQALVNTCTRGRLSTCLLVAALCCHKAPGSSGCNLDVLARHVQSPNSTRGAGPASYTAVTAQLRRAPLMPRASAPKLYRLLQMRFSTPGSARPSGMGDSRGSAVSSKIKIIKKK